MFFICCVGHGNRSVLSEDFPNGYGLGGWARCTSHSIRGFRAVMH
jgi:hypothetical protein